MTIEEEFHERLRRLAEIYDLKMEQWEVARDPGHALQPISIRVKLSGIPKDPSLKLSEIAWWRPRDAEHP
jgi:hypothetical protein